MFKDGTWRNEKLKITVKVIDGIVYIQSDTNELLPLSVRTNEILNNAFWEEIK